MGARIGGMGLGLLLLAAQAMAGLQIAVIPKGTTHEFWKSVHAGAVRAGREAGATIIWKGPLKEDDRDAQISVVEDLISRRVSGIVLAPLDDSALRAPVAAAAKAGIPVLIFDSGLKGGNFISFVATDNFKGGQLAGQEMLRLLKGKGRVLVLRYQEGSASTHEREEGFLSVMAGQAGIEIASSNQYGGATTESAYKASENLLSKFKGPDGRLKLEGIYCPNESTTFGMLRALQDAKLAGTLRFVGFDSSDKLVKGLENGSLDALVLQDPVKMGYEGVKTLVAHLKGAKVPERVDTGCVLVTKKNMGKKAIVELLHPDLERWLK